MTEAELRAEIRQGPSGGYLFYGEEAYLMRRSAAELATAVLSGEPTFDAFNHTVLDGTQTPGDVEKALATLPLMAERTLVEWRSPAMNSWRAEETGAFAALFARLDEYPHAVLLLTAGAADFDPGQPPKKPSVLLQKLERCLKTAAFPLQSEERLRKWILRHLSEEHLRAAPGAAERLLALCGRDMYTLSGEIDKLIAFVLAAGRDEATAADVDAVCCAGFEEDAFGLANAVVNGDRRGALDALYPHKLRREEPLLLLASISRVMGDLLSVARLRESGLDPDAVAAALKMHKYKCGLYCRSVAGVSSDRLAAAFGRCLESDRRIKRGANGYETLERLICTIPARRRKES